MGNEPVAICRWHCDGGGQQEEVGESGGGFGKVCRRRKLKVNVAKSKVMRSR